MKNVQCGTNLCQKLKGAKKLYFRPYFLILSGNIRQVDYSYTVFVWNKPVLETCCFWIFSNNWRSIRCSKASWIKLTKPSRNLRANQNLSEPNLSHGSHFGYHYSRTWWCHCFYSSANTRLWKKDFSRKSGNTNIWPLFPKDLQMCHDFFGLNAKFIAFINLYCHQVWSYCREKN